MARHYTFPDRLCLVLDHIVRTLTNAPFSKGTPSPSQHLDENALTPDEQKHAAALMRINHTGEICAQALYQGQALTARDAEVQHTLAQAAREEIEHLAWSERRIAELNGSKSLLNAFWYGGSLAICRLAC